MWISRASTAAEFEQMLKQAKYKDNSGNDWVRTAGIKIVADGGMTLKSARVREAYADDAHNHGTLALDPEAYKQSVALANQYGWRVAPMPSAMRRWTSCWMPMQVPTSRSRSWAVASS